MVQIEQVDICSLVSQQVASLSKSLCGLIHMHINGIEISTRKHMTEEIGAASAFYFIMKCASSLRLQKAWRPKFVHKLCSRDVATPTLPREEREEFQTKEFVRPHDTHTTGMAQLYCETASPVYVLSFLYLCQKLPYCPVLYTCKNLGMALVLYSCCCFNYKHYYVSVIVLTWC